MASQINKSRGLSTLPQSLWLWSGVVVALACLAFTLLTDASLFSFGTSSLLSPPRSPAQNLSAQFIDFVKARRTYYILDKTLPIGEDEITQIVGELLQAVPSAFNSQSNRAVVLLGNEHSALWDLVSSTLKSDASMSEQRWEVTSQKMHAFKAGAGTGSLQNPNI